MKKNIGLILILLLVVIMLGTYIKQQIEGSQQIASGTIGTEVDLKSDVAGLNKGEIPPDFTLTTLGGESFTLSELKGKKVVLNFWNTWCSPCKAEMPHMQNYYEDSAKKENVEIVAVNLMKTEKIDNVQNFINSYNITFPIPLDVDNKISKHYEVIAIPTSYFIDSKGHVQHKVVGPMDENKISSLINKME